MKFRVTRTSEWGEEWFTEINTLEELIDFEEQTKGGDRGSNGIILWWSGDEKDLPEIEIYDDYRE